MSHFVNDSTTPTCPFYVIPLSEQIKAPVDIEMLCPPPRHRCTAPPSACTCSVKLARGRLLVIKEPHTCSQSSAPSKRVSSRCHRSSCPRLHIDDDELTCLWCPNLYRSVPVEALADASLPPQTICESSTRPHGKPRCRMRASSRSVLPMREYACVASTRNILHAEPQKCLGRCRRHRPPFLCTLWWCTSICANLLLPLLTLTAALYVFLPPPPLKPDPPRPEPDHRPRAAPHLRRHLLEMRRSAESSTYEIPRCTETYRSVSWGCREYIAAAIVFWMSSWVYKYQLMFVFVSKVESGGVPTIPLRILRPSSHRQLSVSGMLLSTASWSV